MSTIQYIPYYFYYSMEQLDAMPPDEKMRILINYWKRLYERFRREDVGMYSKRGLENHMEMYHEAYHALKYWENMLGG